MSGGSIVAFVSTAATAIKQSPDLVEAIDAFIDHKRQSRLTAKERIRIRELDPTVGQFLLGKKNMQGLVDAKNKRDTLHDSTKKDYLSYHRHQEGLVGRHQYWSKEKARTEVTVVTE